MDQIESNKIIPRKFNAAIFSNKEDLEKGEIADALAYNTTIKIKKSGKDIKASLVKVKVQEEAKKAVLKAQLDTAKEACSIIPFQPASEYRLKGFKDCCDALMFPWECCWLQETSMSSTISEYGVKDEATKDPYEGKRATSQEEVICRRKYNDIADKYVEICVDIAMTDMYIRNLDDKTLYELSPSQVIVLGL